MTWDSALQRNVRKGGQPHLCPDCKCPPLCDECGGWGIVSVSHYEPESRPGAMKAMGSISSRPCSKGCRPPVMVL